LAEALADPNQESPASELSRAAPMADQLTVGDIAELFGVSEMTARRWRAAKSNPPIDPAAWIKVNAKDWRFPVSARDARARARIPASDPQAALDSVRRKRAALGFGRSRQKLKGQLAATSGQPPRLSTLTRRSSKRCER